MSVRRSAMSLAVLLGAIGTVAVFTGAAVALFLPASGERDIRPIVTDRSVEGPGAIASLTSTWVDDASTTSPTVSPSEGEDTKTKPPSKPARTTAAGTPRPGGSTTIRRPPAKPGTTAVDDDEDEREDDHEVVTPVIRDEDRPDDQTPQ